MCISRRQTAIFFGAVQHGSPIQAYIVHSDERRRGTDVKLWDRRGNTLDLVLTSCEMEHASQCSFPCDAKVVWSCTPFRSVDETTAFAGKAFNCISKFNGPSTKEFYEGVKGVLGYLRAIMQHKHAAIPYGGRCMGEVTRMIAALEEAEQCDWCLHWSILHGPLCTCLQTHN